MRAKILRVFKSDLEGIQRIVAGAKPKSVDDGENKKEREAIGIVNKARRALGVFIKLGPHHVGNTSSHLAQRS